MIGKLDEQITFQTYTETADGIGGVTKTWANLASDPTVWAQVRAGSGREAFLEDRTNATAAVIFLVRNRADLTEKMRIVWNSETYNIREIKYEGGRSMYLRIVAERGVST